MATVGPNPIPANIGDDPSYRAWAKAVHDALIAVGMIQTADTGQANFATMARPAANQWSANYTIYRFNDAAQATAPVFLKIFWGYGLNPTLPAIAMDFGTGTSGAGVMTGLTSIGVMRQGFTPVKAVGEQNWLYVSGGDGRLMIADSVDFSRPDSANIVIVERLRDETGALTDDGTFVFYAQAAAISGHYIIHHDAGVLIGPKTNIGFPSIDPTFFRSNYGGNLGLSPGLIFLGKPYYLLPLVCGGLQDFPGGVVFTANYLGADRTYLSLTGGMRTEASAWARNATPYLCVPWE
jgi:hypothetical protein